MQRVALEVSVREESGKGPSRRLRANGTIPGVVYGYGVESLKVQVGALLLEKAIDAGSNTLLDLSGDAGLEGKLFLIKEMQRDPSTRSLLHCDFLSVDTRRVIHVAVPLRFAGKPAGVEMGGVLEPLLRELEVSCLPLAIPDAFEVDVSGLAIGDSLHVSDIATPEGVEVLADASVNVVHVIAPRIEEEPEAEEEVPEAVPAEEGAPPEAGATAAEDKPGEGEGG